MVRRKSVSCFVFVEITLVRRKSISCLIFVEITLVRRKSVNCFDFCGDNLVRRNSVSCFKIFVGWNVVGCRWKLKSWNECLTLLQNAFFETKKKQKLYSMKLFVFVEKKKLIPGLRRFLWRPWNVLLSNKTTTLVNLMLFDEIGRSRKKTIWMKLTSLLCKTFCYKVWKQKL